MSSFDERVSRARTELSAMFTPEDAPPVDRLRRRHRRGRAVQLGGGALALALVAIGVLAATVDGREERSGIEVAHTTTTAAEVTADVTARLELETTTVVQGGTIDGELVVQNGSGSPVTLGEDCETFWTVVLTNDAVPPSYAFPLPCSRPPSIAVGETRLAFTVPASYGACTNGDDRDAHLPKCLADGSPPPLPPGEYEAVIVGSDELPFTVEPVRVRVVEAQPTSTTTVGYRQSLPASHTVAATGDGRIVELDDGFRVVREIASLPAGDVADELQLVGDETWFVSVAADPASSCGGPLQRVPLAGGEPATVVDSVVAFAVSPDAERIAYSRSAGCGQTSGIGSRVVIMDRATGEERTWRTPTSNETDDFFAVGSEASEMVWTPDGRRLAVQWCYEGCVIALHDPAVDGTFTFEGTYDGREPVIAGSSLWAAQSYYPEPEPGVPLEIVRLDLSTGGYDTRTSPFAGQPTDLAVGADGSILALLWSPDGERRLQRWDPATGEAGQPVTPAVPIVAVATS
ncbi:MAG: hypothetical protein KatS3mg010_1835 [Acidimicrobiia bacterium]|nr:MAG: hypothetical protein KatS3mg010_1835 [Acidimicrobiia bacterium]